MPYGGKSYVANIVWLVKLSSGHLVSNKATQIWKFPIVEQQQDVRVSVCVYPLNVFLPLLHQGAYTSRSVDSKRDCTFCRRCTLLSLIWQTYLPFCTHFKDKLYFDKLYRMKAIYWIGKIMFTTHCQCSLYIKGLCICNNALRSLLCATIFFWLIWQPCFIWRLFFLQLLQ